MLEQNIIFDSESKVLTDLIEEELSDYDNIIINRNVRIIRKEIKKRYTDDVSYHLKDVIDMFNIKYSGKLVPLIIPKYILALYLKNILTTPQMMKVKDKMIPVYVFKLINKK